MLSMRLWSQPAGADWHLDLAGQRRGLTKESLNVLDRAFLRTRSPDRGKLIAELTFDFWSNLFRTEYGDLWRTKANVVFPGLARGEGRAEIQPLVRAINGIRNRVAHHEPLLDVNIPDIMKKMIRLTELRCPVTANWMRHHSTVNLVMRSKPNQMGSAPQTFATRADPNIRVVGDAVRLDEICQADALTCVAFVCVVDGQVIGAFTHRQMMEFVASKAVLAGGLVDMSDHTVAHMLASAGINGGWTVMDNSTPLSQVIDCLKQPQTRIVVGMAAEGPSGVILRAHRRY